MLFELIYILNGCTLITNLHNHFMFGGYPQSSDFLYDFFSNYGVNHIEVWIKKQIQNA